MTLNGLISAFEVLYDLGNLGLPGIEEEEIIKLLNISQYNLINQRLQGLNAYGTKYPDTIKRIDDLSGLIVEENTDGNITMGSGYGNTKVLTLPEDYFHIVENGVRILYDDNYTEIAKQIKITEAQRFINSRKNGSFGAYVKTPVYHFIQSSGGIRKLIVYPDSETNLATVDIIYCMYITKPTDLENVADADADLTDFNDDVYYEIAKMAVDNATATLSPQKAEISQNQVNKSE